MEARGSGPLPRVLPRDGNNGNGLVLTPAGIRETRRRETSAADITVVTGHDLACTPWEEKLPSGFYKEGWLLRF